MMGGTGAQSQQPEAVKAVRLQTSTYGAVQALVYGTTRITGNLTWYGDFRSTAIPTQSEGK